MTNEELTERLQLQEASLVSTQLALKLVLDAMPQLRNQIQANQQWAEAALLPFDMTDAQIQRATQTLRLLCEGPT